MLRTSILTLSALVCSGLGLLAVPAQAEDELPGTSRFFEEYDRNTDGVVTQDEFEGSSEVFRLLDTNKDGKVTATELGLPADYRPDPNAKKKREAKAKAGKRGRGKNDAKRLARFRKMFKQMDADQDGAVTKAEWKGNPNAFDRFDRNKDGKIDRVDVPGLFADEMMDSDKMDGDMMDGPGRSGGTDQGPASGEAKPNKKPRKAKPGAGGRGALADRVRAMDADGDGAITREEWKGREQLFDRLDRDESGTIEAAELNQLGGRARAKITPEQAATRFASLDKNDDGALTAEDGVQERLMKHMDADADGSVSLAEFQAAVAKTQKQKPSGDRNPRGATTKMIRRFDRDHDGRVSRDEFPASDERFDAMDKDGDGFLTEADTKAAPEKPKAKPITPGDTPKDGDK